MNLQADWRPEPNDWLALEAAADRLPLQQSWAYGDAMAAWGACVRRLILRREGESLAFAQIVDRRFFGLVRIGGLFRGPVFCSDGIDDVAREAVMAIALTWHRPLKGRFLFAMPELEDTEAAQALMRRLGLRQVVTGYSTIWLDLAPDLATLRSTLAQKWRNALNAAERADIAVTIAGRKPRDYRWLLDREDAQRGQRGYHGLPTDLVPLYAAAVEDRGGRAVVAATASHGEDRLAGALFLIHGPSATYMVGWNGAMGRKLGAHNLALWCGIEALKERGVRWLDLGGVNTAEGAGIARFKLGLGGEVVTLAGTFL